MTADTSGTLRLARTGDQLSAYFKQGNRFVRAGKATVSRNETTFVFAASVFRPAHRPPNTAVARVAFDNFRVVRGQVDCPSGLDLYVALGDSFSSGHHAGRKYDNPSSCGRSEAAFPVLFLEALGFGDFIFKACSGAATNDILKKQVPILDKTPGESLVTVTAGANDIEFGKIAKACLTILNLPQTCATQLGLSLEILGAELPQRLAGLFGAIDSAVDSSARVIVVGYPYLTPSQTAFDLGIANCVGVAFTQGEAAMTGPQ